MPLLELPHAADCLVCGRFNSHGLKLSLFVDPETGQVQTEFAPSSRHVGFESIVHGGVLATVLDEAMVWSASWRYRRFCLCGELTVRYLLPVRVEQSLVVTGQVQTFRPRMAIATGEIRDSQGQTLVQATGKYIPMEESASQQMIASMVPEETTVAAAEFLLRKC